MTLEEALAVFEGHDDPLDIDLKAIKTVLEYAYTTGDMTVKSAVQVATLFTVIAWVACEHGDDPDLIDLALTIVELEDKDADPQDTGALN